MSYYSYTGNCTIGFHADSDYKKIRERVNELYDKFDELEKEYSDLCFIPPSFGLEDWIR